MISLVGRKFTVLMHAPLFIKLWLLPAWVLLGLGRLTVLIIPFRRIVPLLGNFAGTESQLPLLAPDQRNSALLIGQTVRMAGRHAPWRANCFAQAIAASLLLRLYKIPYSIFFGVRPTIAHRHSPIEAHAWTAAGDVAITGGQGFKSFTVVAVFHTIPSPPKA
jgi:hypothetical protein